MAFKHDLSLVLNILMHFRKVGIFSDIAWIFQLSVMSQIIETLEVYIDLSYINFKIKVLEKSISGGTPSEFPNGFEKHFILRDFLRIFEFKFEIVS